MTDLTRDQARQAWIDSGLTHADLTPENLRVLRWMINRSMLASGLMGGTYRAHQRFSCRLDPNRRFADLRCRSGYFDSRQAITFDERDGIGVGFAGWADQWNVQPILTDFVKWVEIVAAGKAMAAREGGAA